MIRKRFSSDMPNSIDMKTAFANAYTITPGGGGCWIMDSRFPCVRDVGNEMRRSEAFLSRAEHLWLQNTEGWSHLSHNCRNVATLHYNTVELKETNKERFCFCHPSAASYSFNATNFFQVVLSASFKSKTEMLRGFKFSSAKISCQISFHRLNSGCTNWLRKIILGESQLARRTIICETNTESNSTTGTYVSVCVRRVGYIRFQKKKKTPMSERS